MEEARRGVGLVLMRGRDGDLLGRGDDVGGGDVVNVAILIDHHDPSNPPIQRSEAHPRFHTEHSRVVVVHETAPPAKRSTCAK